MQFSDMRQSPAMSTAGCGPRGRPQAANFEGVRDSLGIANASPTIPSKELQLIDVGKRRWKIDSNSSIGNKRIGAPDNTKCLDERTQRHLYYIKTNKTLASQRIITATGGFRARNERGFPLCQHQDPTKEDHRVKK